jgi:hypothetical protein
MNNMKFLILAVGLIGASLCIVAARNDLTDFYEELTYGHSSLLTVLADLPNEKTYVGRYARQFFYALLGLSGAAAFVGWFTVTNQSGKSGQARGREGSSRWQNSMNIDVNKTPDGLPRVAWQEPVLSVVSGIKIHFYLLAAITFIAALLFSFAINIYAFPIIWGVLFVVGMIKSPPQHRFPKAIDRECYVEKRGNELYFRSNFYGNDDPRQKDEPQKWEIPLHLLSAFMLSTEKEWLQATADKTQDDRTRDQFVIFAVSHHGRRVLVSLNCMNRSDNADLHAVLREQFSPADFHSTDSGGSQQYQQREEADTGQWQHENRQSGGRSEETAQPSGDYAAAMRRFGLSEPFTKEQLAAAYREKVNALHPDRWEGLPPHIKQQLDDHLKELNAARDLIKKLKGWR